MTKVLIVGGSVPRALLAALAAQSVTSEHVHGIEEMKMRPFPILSRDRNRAQWKDETNKRGRRR